MRFTSFQVSAHINNAERLVDYVSPTKNEAGKLVINSVTETEVLKLIQLLEGTTPTAENDGPPVPTDPSTPKAMASPTPRVDPAAIQRFAQASPAKPPKQAKGKKEKEPEPVEEPQAAEEPCPVDSTVSAKKSNGHNGAANGNGTVDVPDEVKNAKLLKEVLSFLISKGITDTAALVAECLRLQPHVPVLARISNIEERVGRALQVLDLGEGVE